MKNLFTIVGLLFLACTGSLSGQTTAIQAGHLIDPATGKITDNQTILVQEGKITAVGAGLSVPESAHRIDLADSWVMPGLMDAHVHLTFNMPPHIPQSVRQLAISYINESTALRALLGMHNARLVLEAGFTTLKDIGNDANYAAVDVRRAIEKGWYTGPTLLNSGKIIAPFGGQSRGVPAEIGPFWQFEYIDADSPDELRKAVRQNIYYGANTIKLVADNSAFFYSEEELRAAVAEAHAAGLTITVHAYGGQAASNVIAAGADGIEHGFDLSDAHLLQMKEKGTFLIGTDFPYEHLAAFWTEKKAREVGDKIIDRLRRAHKIGVKMAFGTDVVVDLPGKNRVQMMWDYLDIWLQAGIPPAKILKCMTTNAAELFRIQDVRGAIAEAQFADIIATPQNPLQDINALRRTHFVMKEGQVVKQENLATSMTKK